MNFLIFSAIAMLLLLIPGVVSATTRHHGGTGSIGISGYLIDPSMIAQTPVTVTESSNNDSSAIDVTITSVTKGTSGYHFVGEITNIGTAEISNVRVTVHLHDSNTDVGNITQYIKPENIDVDQRATFDGFVASENLNTEPSIFWLSFDWT
jgi:hypothetical protein